MFRHPKLSLALFKSTSPTPLPSLKLTCPDPLVVLPIVTCVVTCPPCRHGPKRADYITDFWKVVNWAQVSKNFAAAKKGDVQAMVA